MDFLTLAQQRYSVRSFQPDPIPQEQVDRILEAARLAPSARNNQPLKIFVIRSDAARIKLKNSTECHFNAPLAFLICYDRTQVWPRVYDGKISGDIDASIAATHMMMEATEMGIGSTWVMYFDPEATRRNFELPESLEPTAFLVMGYPSADAAPSPRHAVRKTKEELITEV